MLASDDASSAITFDRLVDRRLVHKRAHGEVFVTSVIPRCDNRWLCGVQFSPGHSRMPAGGGALPLVLVLEACRQSGIAISHVGLDVSLESQFVLDAVEVSWVGKKSPGVRPVVPVEAELDIEVVEVQRRRGAVCGVVFTGSLLIEGVVSAVGSASMRCLDPGLYRVLRRHAANTREVFNVPSQPLTLTEGGLAVVGWNAFDPMIFDHPLDHVPGMALLDAALATAGAQAIKSVEIEFLRFAELDRPVLLVKDSPAEAKLRFLQGNSVVATARIATFQNGFLV